MKLRNRAGALLLAAVLLLCLAGCGWSDRRKEAETLHLANSFSYSSLDPHKDYYGWYTSCYGVTETLFQLNDRMGIDPWLAESAEQNGRTWTIRLNRAAAFSNGKPLTAEMVIRNLKRAAEVNPRFSYFGDYAYRAVSERELTITTPETEPVLKNDLASPELAMLDLDGTKDIDRNPIATGPFLIESFTPQGDTIVRRNPHYWNGTAKVKRVVFHYMQEDETKLLAMEGNEIQGYDSVTANACLLYRKHPEKYKLTNVRGTRLQFCEYNERTMDANLRRAVNGSFDKQEMMRYLHGTVAATDGPFPTNTAYGKVEHAAKRISRAEAQALIEKDGYRKGKDGYYQKGGKRLTLRIAYYPARSLDSLALLMQEQLKKLGVASTLHSYEDPDSTYMASHNFDIALYCMIADKTGDPYYFIDSVLKSDGAANAGGYRDSRTDALIRQLKPETDPAQRAELAREIVQRSIDSDAIGYIGMFNKITVLAPGLTGYAASNPADYYAIDANTDWKGA